MNTPVSRWFVAALLASTACAGDDVDLVTDTLPDARVGEDYSTRFVASGGDGAYAFTLGGGALPAGLSLSTEGVLSGAPREGGKFEFEVTVQSGGETDTESFDLSVDAAAQLSIDTPSTLPMATVGVAYETTIVASGGEQIDYSWSVANGALPDGVTLAGHGTPMTTVSGTPTEAGTFQFGVAVTDDRGAMDTVQFTFVVMPSHPSLMVTTEALPDGVVDIAYEGLLEAGNADGLVTWRVSQGSLPTGLMLDATGDTAAAITGTPSEDGSFTLEIEATDASGGIARRTFTFTIALDPQPLVIEEVQIPVARIGASFAAAVTARGGTNRGYTWFVRSGSLPRGIVLQTEGTPSTQLLGTPESAAGFYDFVLDVQDSQGNKASANLRIVVESPAITLLNRQLPDANVGVPYDVELIATGGDGGPYAFVAAGGALAPGLGIDASGALVGTPTMAGSFTFVVRITDGSGNTNTAQLSLDVEEVLAIPSTALPEATVGVTYAAVLSAVGGTPPYTWTSAGALPAGLTIQTGAGMVTLAGTPTMAGNFTFDLTVTDADGGRATANYALVVHPELTITTASLPDGNAFDPYLAMVVASGGAPGSLQWNVSAGALPVGVQLVSDGSATASIEGTPTTVGTASFTLSVTDSNGTAATQSFTVDVTGNLTIRELALPGGVVGQPYATTLQGAGGSDTGFTWQISSGNLPAGLTLTSGTPDATIAGTPTTVQVATFDVTLTDSLGATITRTYTITTANAPLVITTTTLGAAVLCQDTSTQLAVTGGTGSGLTYAVTDGTFPPGLVLDAMTGLISGRVTTPGSYTFTITAQDDGNFVDTQTFTLDVVPAPTLNRFALLTGDLTLNNRNDAYVVPICGAAPGALVRISPDAPHAADVAALEDLAQLAPDASKAAFVGDFDTDGTNDLYVVDLLPAAPSEAVRVNGTMVTGGNVTDFFWSPDGGRIAFVADKDVDDKSELYFVDVSNPAAPGQPAKISPPMGSTDNGITPDMVLWSPDSNRLAFHADADIDGVGEIFLVDVTNPTQIVGPAKVHADLGTTRECTTDIVWAPDSSGIAFRCDLVVSGRFEPYWFNPDANMPQQPTRLANQPFDAFDDVVQGSMRFAPTLPVRLMYLADLTYNGSYEIWHSTFESGLPGPFARVMSGLAPTESVTRAIWSEQGDKIALRGDLIVDGRFGLSYLDLSGGVPTSTIAVRPFTTGDADIADSQQRGEAFEFSPDGRYLMFIADAAASAEYRLWSADLDPVAPAISAESEATGDGARDVVSFAIDPSSERVVYGGDVAVDDRFELRVVGIAGFDPLEPAALHGALPADGDVHTYMWRPDGEAVLYAGDTRVESVVEASMVTLDPTNGQPMTPMLMHPASSILEDVRAVCLP
ncbi:MAG: putative Ig domain-containing protein [Deltaproteobacteria bacterium]